MYEREGRKWKIEKESGVLDMMDGAAMRGGGHILYQLPLCQTRCCAAGVGGSWEVSVCVCTLYSKCVFAACTMSLRTGGGLTDYLSWSRLEGSLALSLSLTPHFPQSLIHFAPLDDNQGHCNTAKVLDGTWYQEAQGWVSTFIFLWSSIAAKIRTRSEKELCYITLKSQNWQYEG